MKLKPIEHLFESDLLLEIKEVAFYNTIEKDNFLIDFGQRITHIPIVLKGTIKVMREDRKGGEILLYYLEPGDTCAVTLNCCTTNHFSEVRAVTEETTEILFVPVEKMEQWLIQYHSWRRFILNNFNYRFEEMLEAVDNLAFQNMEERVVTYLENKKNILKKAEFELTHHQIAQDLNSSRVVVSRILKKLDQANIIQQTYNKIKLLK